MKAAHVIVVALAIVCGCSHEHVIIPHRADTRDDLIQDANRTVVVDAAKNGRVVIQGERIALSNLATRLTDAGFGPNCSISMVLPPGFPGLVGRDTVNLHFDPRLTFGESVQVFENLKKAGIGNGLRLGQ